MSTTLSGFLDFSIDSECPIIANRLVKANSQHRAAFFSFTYVSVSIFLTVGHPNVVAFSARQRGSFHVTRLSPSPFVIQNPSHGQTLTTASIKTGEATAISMEKSNFASEATPAFTRTTIETIFSFLKVDTQSDHDITWSIFPYVTTAKPTFDLIPLSSPFPTKTLTLTEVNVILFGDGSTYSTLITTLPTLVPTSGDFPIVLVEPTKDHGWDNWSDSQKGGLVAGIILATAAIIIFVMWVRRRNAVWIAPEWWPYHA